MRGQDFDELVVGEAAGLGVAVHAAADFNVDVPVVEQRA